MAPRGWATPLGNAVKDFRSRIRKNSGVFVTHPKSCDSGYGKTRPKEKGNNVKLQFLGATRQVTGSQYYLQADGAKVLVDCGMFQERKHQGRNWEPSPLNPKKLDALLLTHAHVDHCGLTPKLVHGFSGHADRAALMRWLGHFQDPPEQLFLTHGEQDQSLALAQHVRETLGWNVTVPEYRQTVELEGGEA